MKKGEARDAILEELEKLLGPMGFRVKRKSAELIRKTPGGRQRIVFTLHDFNPVFAFSLLPSIQFDEMDELYFNAIAQERPEGPYWDIGISRSYLFEGVPEKFKVESVEQIERAISELRPSILGRMIPFFQQWESLAAFESIINSGTDRCTTLHAPSNAFVYIMASYLANRERLDEMLSKWVPLPDIGVVDESDREHMRRLVAFVHASRG